MAVARIQGGACGGCRVSLPDAVRKLAFSAEQIPQCPNCERILYFG
jgi:predicted  nucleic acid-binding Zn-ribbon protein